MSASQRLFSTGDLARFLETDRQTILAWDRRGVLSPSKRLRGRRLYSRQDLVAALTIPGARAMGLPHYAVNRIVEIVLEANEETLKRAMLVTFRTAENRQPFADFPVNPGMMRHLLLDVDDEGRRKELRAALRRDQGKPPQQREIIAQVTLHEIVHEGILPMLTAKLRDRAARRPKRGGAG